MKSSSVTAIIVLLNIIICQNIYSQNIRNEDLVYDSNIHTVLLHPSGDQLLKPTIRLNSNDKLLLSFDDMSRESYKFKYTYIHCDENWNESDLNKMDYLDGYFEDDITSYEFSLNAIPPYIHYQKVLPTNAMKIKISGNYILKVYLDSDDDDNVLFTSRFYVVEDLCQFDIMIPYYPKNLEYVRKKQQIDLAIETPDLFSAEPLKRTSITIQQNGRWDNIKRDIKPTAVSMNKLEFHYPKGIVFEGGYEFRNFDMKDYYYQSMSIKQIISDPDGYRVILHADRSRADKPYSDYDDINGKEYIKARAEQNTSTEGEYATVEFTLQNPEFKNADVFVLGALTGWQLNDTSRMRYDSRFRSYKLDLFLKQGYYDYLYVVVPDGQTKGSVSVVEGDHWETNNEYTIFVYYHTWVPEYDRLIGYMNFNSFDVSTE